MRRRPKPELRADAAQSLALAYAQADFSDAHRLFLDLLRDLNPGNLEGKQALDLGCGPGNISIRFLKAWPGARCDALDGSAPMLASAQTALDALRRVRPDQPFSCRQGFCGACVVGLTGGRVDHRDRVLSRTERENSLTLCVSRAAVDGDVVVLDL